MFTANGGGSGSSSDAARFLLAALLFSLFGHPVPAGAAFPGATWAFKTPAELALDSAKLDAARDYIGGRGCVVRHGYMGYTWGDQSQRQDVASACKPWYSTFLFKRWKTAGWPASMTLWSTATMPE